MDAGGSKKLHPRELPPLPQRGQRSLPTMPSQDSAGEVPPSKQKKKRARKGTNGVDDVDDQGTEMGGLGGRRESQIGESLPFEAAADAPAQRKRKKKKISIIDLEDDQTDLVNEDVANQTTDGEETVRKPKKKRKPKVIESQVPDDLCLEEDDIITDSFSPIPHHALFAAPQGPSQPVGKVFVERNKRFQAADRSDWRKTSDQNDNMADFQHTQPHWTTRDVSIRLHGGFRGFGLYCHGFLAGYAVWNVVVVYMLAGPHLTALSNLLEHYHNLAYPFQSLLYMLLAISTVAAFDRLNLAKGAMAFRELITLEPVALASFLYFSALVLTLSQQMTSDRINLYPAVNTTLWPTGSEHQILNPWVTVNLVVALLVGVAWIFIVARPDTDFTESSLRAMEIEPPRPEDKSELTV